MKNLYLFYKIHIKHQLNLNHKIKTLTICVFASFNSPNGTCNQKRRHPLAAAALGFDSQNFLRLAVGYE